MARLTPREKQIAGLLASGKSQGQIARALNLSIHTVRNYLRNARMKTQSNTSAELACKYVRAQ